MLKEIYLFELRYNLKRIAPYVFMAMLAFFAFMDASNVMPGRTVITVHGQIVHNAPITIARVLAFMSVIGILFTLFLTATNVVRDFDNRIHEFFFSSTITKFGYLAGRFLGGLTVAIMIYIGAIIGLLIGCSVIENQFVGAYQFLPFFQAFIYFVIPNVLFLGVLLFTCAALTRNMFSTYILVIFFIALYFIIGITLEQQEENRLLMAWLDPFGFGAIDFVTLFWTVAERNTTLLPFDGIILWNRLLTLLSSTMMFTFLYYRFKFTHQKEGRKHKFNFSDVGPVSKAIKKLKKLPLFVQHFSWRANIRQCFAIVKIETLRFLKHPAFLVLMFMCMQPAYDNFVSNVGPHQSNVYPLTSWYIRWGSQLFGFMIPLTIFFAGVIVWRQRDNRSDEIYETMPVPNWVPFLANSLTLMTAQFVFILATILTGIFAQGIVFGYTNFELSVYAKVFLGIELLNYWHFAFLALLIQTLVSNKYLGYFICAAYFVLDLVLYSTFGVTNFMLRFGQVPPYIYSNLNGFGHFAEPILWYRLYWMLLSVVLITCTALLWRRGKEVHLKFRLRIAKQRINRCHVLAAGISGAAFCVLGGYIYYNSFILNPNLTSQERIKRLADYEKNYVKFAERPHPTITEVSVNVDLFPEKRDAFIRGSYILENKTESRVDSLHINLVRDRINKINRFTFTKPAEVVHQNEELGYSIYALDTPLLPGDTTRLQFDYVAIKKGFTENDQNKELVYNGTYIDNFPFSPEYYFPSVGYNLFKEIKNNQLRSKHGLSHKPNVPILEDSLARAESISEYVTFEATVSTSLDQIAVANGALDRTWRKDGRNYYHYFAKTPLNNALVILSGRYEILRDRHKSVDIEIYYHTNHAYNIQRMVNGIKRSFDYCIKNFGPYPYSTVKIVEVPDYGIISGTARSQPTVFTWTENGGFISNLEATDATDIVFSTTAHEMAHQWWGHMVQPATVEGLGVLTETISQWVRMMCVEKEYGVKKTRDFLKSEMENYLFWRGRQVQDEIPLIKASSQPYLNYNKGSVVMYAMGDYIGEDRVNTALRNLVNTFAFSEKVYPTTLDLMDEFRAVTPDSLNYVINDLFETITLYNNNVVKAMATRISDDIYKVNLRIKSEKMRADGKGNERVIPISDYIDIGVFAEDGRELYLKKHWIRSQELELEIVVDDLPAQAGIDPYLKLIDRKRNDNLTSVLMLDTASKD